MELGVTIDLNSNYMSVVVHIPLLVELMEVEMVVAAVQKVSYHTDIRNMKWGSHCNHIHNYWTL